MRLEQLGLMPTGVGLAALTALLLPAPAALANKLSCPAGMVSVAGRFCVDAFEASVEVVDDKGHSSRRQSPYHMPAATDRLRARSRRGVVPQAYISQEQARDACEAAGKRLCSDAEWLAACKGRNQSRYPYGEEREDGACNDKGVSPLRVLHGAAEGLEIFGIDAMNDPKLNQIPGSVARTGQFKRCKTSFGAYDMVGNLHEWTADPEGTFRGGYYLDNEINGQGCNYITTGHNVKYHDYSIGFRCCKASSNSEDKQERPKSSSKTGKQKIHVVEDGESLGRIAKRYGTSVGAICEANGIERKARIHPGDELVIPD